MSDNSEESSDQSSREGTKSNDDINYVYQAVCYFGIHYDIEHSDKVKEALIDTKYKALFGDDSEYETKKHGLFIRNQNSDDEPSTEIIFADNMIIQSEEKNSPDVSLKVTTFEFEQLEEKYPTEVEIITNIYDLLIKYAKIKSWNTSDLYCGWGFYNCCWVD